MTYLILHKNEAFYSNWFDFDNNYVDGMVVFNLHSNMYTVNGFNWFEIAEDCL